MTMDVSTRHRLWACLNAVGLLLTLVMNGLANALPLNGKATGELSDLYPNLFVPAGLTFSIWGVIYLLLFGFVGFELVCAFRGRGHRAALDAVGPWFFVSCLANSSWIVAWHWVRPGVALGLMLLLLASLLGMSLRLYAARNRRDGLARLLVDIPVSVYLGWISVATIANATALLVYAGHAELPPGPVFWTVTMITVATFLAALMSVLRRDRAFAAVVAWALLGIVIKRRAVAQSAAGAATQSESQLIESVATAGIIAVVILAAAHVLFTRRGGKAAGNTLNA